MCDRCGELEEEVIQLRAELCGPDDERHRYRLALGLRPGAAAILVTLMRVESADRERLRMVLQTISSRSDGGPVSNVIGVMLSQVRSALRRRGAPTPVMLGYTHDRGGIYRLSAAQKAEIRALVASGGGA